ncbi:MAG: potassium channel protein [Planctomycetota bacterium]
MASQQPSSTTAKTSSTPLGKVLVGIFSFTLICLIAVIGYVLAGWSVGDAFYMVIITIFGVGYGEVQPVQSPALRLLTITVIIAGYAAVIYTVGGFVQILIDGELNRALGVRRMTKGIERLSEHTIICGIGRLGSILAAELHASKKPFVAIDSSIERVRNAEESGYLVIHGDAAEESILEQAGIRRASTVATVLSLDATNLFVTITAREMNPEVTIIARGENPRTEKKLIHTGADKVVLPTAIGAKKMAQLIIRPSAENMLEQIQDQSSMIDDLKQIGLQFDEIQVEPNSPMVDCAISDIEIRSNHGFLIVGIRRSDGTNQINPEPGTKLSAGDVVIALGHQDDIPDLAKRFSAKKTKIVYRGATLET